MASLDTYIANSVKHWSQVLGVAIDPALVRAVIQQESGGGKVLSTVEPHGHMSYGPMMVKDSTATGYGVTDPSRLKDPGLGIWYGVRYLGEQLRRFGGDVAAALAAYNGGPGIVGRVDASGTFPNQTYVDRVLGYYRSFQGAALPVLALVLGFALVLATRRRRAA